MSNDMTEGLRKALGTLRAFADNLPKGSTVEEKYVVVYHSLLTDIAKETNHNLDYFRVPDSELTTRSAGGEGDDFGNWTQFYHDYRECDMPMFRIKLDGALNFIASLLEPPGRRMIGF